MTSVFRKVSNYLVSNESDEVFPDQFTKDIDIKRKEKKSPSGIFKVLPFLLLFNYYPSHYSKFEKKLLMKIDISVALYLATDFYCKHLDSANITNAYVANMKEDLHLYGNELNYFSTFYSIGYCIGQLPAVLLANKRGWARYLLLVSQLVWGIATFALSAARHATDVYAIRFIIGLAESAAFPVSYLIMSSWYTPDELYLRAALFNFFSQIGALSSGFLQTAAHNLDHVGTAIDGSPMSGWRWQFIVDGLITVVLGLIWLFLFPGTLGHKKFGIFSQDDMVLARKRMIDAKTVFPKRWDKATWTYIVKSWKPYFLIALWVAHHQMGYDSSFALYLKSEPDKYSITDRTNWPTLIPALGAIAAFTVPPLQNKYGKQIVCNIIFAFLYFHDIVLIIWDVPTGLKFFAYALQGLQVGLAPTFYAWGAIICKESAELKAITLGLMNCLSYVTQAWTPIVQWPQSDGPRFWLGFRVDIAMIVACHVLFILVWILERRDNRNEQFENSSGDDELSVSFDDDKITKIEYDVSQQKKEAL